MNTFDEAAKAAVLEAIRRAGNLTKLSVQTNIRPAYLAAYKSGMTIVPEEHLRVIHDYLKLHADTP